MSHSRESFFHSNSSKMLSPEVRPIGESSNDDSSHRHDGSDVASDQESSVPILIWSSHTSLGDKGLRVNEEDLAIRL